MLSVPFEFEAEITSFGMEGTIWLREEIASCPTLARRLYPLEDLKATDFKNLKSQSQKEYKLRKMEKKEEEKGVQCFFR